MQPDGEYIKQASWGRRLLIAGVISFVFGGLFFYYQIGQLPEIIDPNKNNVVDVNIGEQTSVDLRNSCYVAWSENTSSDITFKIFDSEDSEISETSCGFDLEAMDAEGTGFQRIGSWEIDSGTYNVHAVCTSESEGRCSEGNVMLVDYDDIINQVLGDSAFILSCLVCLAGVILLPLGGVLLHMAGRNRQSKGVVLMEGGVMPPANQIDEGGLEYYTEQQAINEEMLTTDEVYSLMHGSEEDKVEILERLSTVKDTAEGAAIPDPFADSMFKDNVITPKTKMDIVPGKNSEPEKDSKVDSSWIDWDEG